MRFLSVLGKWKRIRIRRGKSSLSLPMTVRKKQGGRFGEDISTEVLTGMAEGKCSLSVRETTSESDRAVGRPSPGLPISLMSQHTQNMVFVQHAGHMEKAVPRGLGPSRPCLPRGWEEGWHTGSHAHRLGSSDTYSTGTNVFLSPKIDQSSISWARLRRQMKQGGLQRVECSHPAGTLQDWVEKLLVGESRKGLFTEYKDKHITGLKKYCPQMSVLVKGADN